MYVSCQNGQIMKDTMPERKGFGVQHNSQTKSKGIFQQSETGNVVNPIVTPEKVKFWLQLAKWGKKKGVHGARFTSGRTTSCATWIFTVNDNDKK